MVDKSASADLCATKTLFDMMKDVEHKAGDAARRPNPAGSPRRTRRWCSYSWRGCGPFLNRVCSGGRPHRDRSVVRQLPPTSCRIPALI
jgi:hypothetical protein